jgi:hypothetical protein
MAAVRAVVLSVSLTKLPFVAEFVTPSDPTTFTSTTPVAVVV